MMSSILRNLINTAVIITAGAWVTSAARAEIPVPTGDAGNEAQGDNGGSVPPLAERIGRSISNDLRNTGLGADWGHSTSKGKSFVYASHFA